MRVFFVISALACALLISSVGFAIGAVSQDTGSNEEKSITEKARRQLHYLSSFFYLSEESFKKFDRELESGEDIWSSRDYRKLLMIRSLLHQYEGNMENEMMADPAYALAVNKEIWRFAGPSEDGVKGRDTGNSSAHRILNFIRDHWESVYTERSYTLLLADTDEVYLRVLNLAMEAEIDREDQKPIRVGSGFRNINGNGFGRGRWALTYDDGPSAKLTPQVLRLLKQYGQTATFFVLGRLAKANPALIKNLVSNGMEIGNHSMNHADMNRLGASALDLQINQSSDIIESITGRKLRYFRLPYGSGQKNGTIQRMLSQRGLIHVGWNVDSLDWRDKNASSIHNRVVRQMRNAGSGVILFHDIHSRTIQASEMLLRDVSAGKISGRLITVSEAL